MEENKQGDIPKYNGDDITQPICDIEQIKRLAAERKYPVPFISNMSIGWGLVKKTGRMKKPVLKTQFAAGYGKCFNTAYPEGVIRNIVIEYCNQFPFPEMLLNRIKKDLEQNIKFKPDKQKDNGGKTS